VEGRCVRGRGASGPIRGIASVLFGVVGLHVTRMYYLMRESFFCLQILGELRWL
jgi:hypothetical protein